MKTTTYSEVRNLAAYLAGRADDTTGTGLRLPPSEATLLLAFLAAELLTLWTAEAWPELCPDIETITLAADKTFSKREGDEDEMGDVLAIFRDGNPQTTTLCTPIEDWVEANGKVRVNTDQTTLYVEYMTPATDLLSIAAGSLEATTMPRRFRQPLAFKAAAWLLATEDPATAEKFRQLGEGDWRRQAGVLALPWWRKPVMKR